MHRGQGFPHRCPLVPRRHGGAGRVGGTVGVALDEARQENRDYRDGRRRREDHCDVNC